MIVNLPWKSFFSFPRMKEGKLCTLLIVLITMHRQFLIAQVMQFFWCTMNFSKWQVWKNGAIFPNAFRVIKPMRGRSEKLKISPFLQKFLFCIAQCGKFLKNVPWVWFWKIGNFLLRVEVGLIWKLRWWHIWKMIKEAPLLSFIGEVIKFVRPIYLVEIFQTSIKS